MSYIFFHVICIFLLKYLLLEVANSMLVYQKFIGNMIETYNCVYSCHDLKPVLKINTYGKTRGQEVMMLNERYNTNVVRRVWSTMPRLGMDGTVFKEVCSKCQIMELVQKETGRLLWRQKIFMRLSVYLGGKNKR